MERYTPEEKAELVALFALLCLFAGGILCLQLSYDADLNMTSPALHLIGMLLMLIIPGAFCIIIQLSAEISPLWPFAYLKNVPRLIGQYVLVAVCVSFYYSSGQSYISGATVVGLALAWIFALFFAHEINYRLLATIKKEKSSCL